MNDEVAPKDRLVNGFLLLIASGRLSFKKSNVAKLRAINGVKLLIVEPYPLK